MMEVDEKGSVVWCPLTYEFLPDFCFTCGVFGHGMRSCSIKLTGGDKPQYGNWLKADVGRKRLGEERNSKRGEGFGSFGFRGLGSRWGGKSRSDSDSWRKDGSISSGCKGGPGEKREGVLSPAKEREAVQGAWKARSLFKESDKVTGGYGCHWEGGYRNAGGVSKS
jgi:hypothetical protein